MKRKPGMKALALLLTAGMLFAGCGGSAGDTPEGESETGGSEKTMGRYMEETVGKPEDMMRNAGITRLTDGSLQIFDYYYGPCISRDEGKTWARKYDDWIGMVGDAYYMNAAMAKDGTLFLMYNSYEEEADEADDETKADNEAEASEETGQVTEDDNPFKMDYRYMIVSPEGELRDLPVPFNTDNYEILINCWYTPDSRLFASQGGVVYEINQEDGTLTRLFDTEGDVELACFSDTRMAAFTTARAYSYDYVNGELLEQDDELDSFVKKQMSGGMDTIFYTSGNYKFIAALDKENTLYLGCDEGIYSYKEGEGIKQLLEGGLCSLADPSVAKYGMLAEDGPEFLILLGSGVSRFTFDETVPSVPDKELLVYSLKKDRTIQQAVSAYQKEHNDVYVRYEVGMSGDNGLTAEDAVKALNTEIMAGKGPDVLCLDGLPLDSYLSKGILADLSDTLKAAEEKEEFFDNITRAFEEDGKIYALPTRFRIPLLVGKQETLAGIRDLQSFADACEKLRAENPEGSILSAYQPDIVLRMLALACEPSWSGADGTLDEETVREFLTQAKRVYDAEISGISEREMEDFLESNRSRGDEGGSYAETALDISYSIMNFLTKTQEQFGLGNTQQVSLDFTNVISIPRVKKEIVFTTPSFQNSKVFQAESIMGVSARAAQPEMARDFIQMLLSYEVMASQEAPYPVNKASFDRMFYTEMDPDASFGSYGIAREDGSVLMLDLYWPNEEEQKGLKDLVSSLNTPYLPDSRIEQAVVAAGTQVLNGELSVEEGAAQVKQKVQLYLAE